MESLTIETGLNACFSSDKIKLQISIAEDRSAQISIQHRDNLPITISSSRSKVIDFIVTIISAILRTEKISNSKSTTSYYCNVQWQDFDLLLPDYPSSGKIETISNEIPPEEVKKILAKEVQKNSAVGQKYSHLLNEELHVRPIAVYHLTKKFVAEFNLNQPIAE